MARRIGTGFLIGLFAVALTGWSLLASDAEMYFSYDKNGERRVSKVQEGESVFVVVVDNDENTDCDLRDKIWTDVKIMDPKTGAFLLWRSYRTAAGDADGDPYEAEGYIPYKGHSPGPTAGWLGSDYLEETDADSGVFVSKRSFQIGSRVSYADPALGTHVVDGSLPPTSFLGGGFYYWIDIFNADDPLRGGTLDYMVNFGLPVPIHTFTLEQAMELWKEYRDVLLAYFPPPPQEGDDGYIIGRFENMDTLIGLIQDQNDETDVAVSMIKIIDTEATIAWDRTVYGDANEAATLTVVDSDENLDCSRVECVPLFILVNPGAWNPVRVAVPDGIDLESPTNFCMFKLMGGVAPTDHEDWTAGEPLVTEGLAYSIMWYNIYGSGVDWSTSDPRFVDSAYYMEYPTPGDGNVCSFDTANDEGFVKVSYHAYETGPDTGIFQLNLNSLLTDLGFNSLGVGDVLAAYYLDPNDEDDFKLATATIETRERSTTRFTDATGSETSELSLGHDSIYLEVIDSNANVDPCCPEQVVVHLCDPHESDDSEWLILDESSSNSPRFVTPFGVPLKGPWDASGIGLGYEGVGGFQLRLDNWILEAFNEDEVVARYNDVLYETGADGLAGVGDADYETAFPPRIARTRVTNDISFGVVSISDSQVHDGTTTQMWFLDRNGNIVTGYAASDCVFIEVVDPDQDEDPYRRERIDAYWDGGQNAPFGPIQLNEFLCGSVREGIHPINALLGDTNIFNDAPEIDGERYGLPKVYVLNPRSGRWAALDLLETAVSSADFVSVMCVDLVGAHTCVPSLGALPGDTILAFYQDPSNHSDSAMIAIKVGIGGSGSPPGQASTTRFVNTEGMGVENYVDTESVTVMVIDPSHAGEPALIGVVEIDGVSYDLSLRYDVQTFAPAGTFYTDALDLDLVAGETLTATYTDPTDPADVSSDTVSILSSVLSVESFYATPSPFEIDCAIGYAGSGIAATMSVNVYDLSGALVWSQQASNVSEIVWDGTAGAPCIPAANGVYIYVVTVTDGTSTFTGKGTLFVSR